MARSKASDPNLAFNKKRWRRRILVRGLTVIAIVAIALAATAIWVARALPRIAVAEISRLTNTRIETGAFDFHRDASVSIDGLVIRPKRGQLLYDDTILRAKNVYARFSPGSVFLLSPKLTEIRIEDFILDAQFDLDTGQWNIGDLQVNLPQGGSGAMPAVVLQQGKLRYCKASGGKTEVVTSVPIEARFGFGKKPGRGYEFEIKTAKLSGGHGESSLSGYWRPGELAFAGGLSSTDIPSLERAWAVDVSALQLKYDGSGNYTLDLRMANVHGKQSPEVDMFRMLMPARLEQTGPLSTLQKFFARYRPSGILGEVTLKASGNFDRLNESEITGKVICEDVSLCDRKFPYTIDHLTGQLDLTQSMVIANQVTGKHGDVDLLIEGWTRGYGEERQYQYRVTSENMVLDEALYAALQPEQKRLWDAFDPSGVVGLDYRVMRTSPTEKRRYVSVELHDVAATYQKLPYPLQGLTGKLYFDRESIMASDIVSETDGRRIKLGGKVTGRNTDKPIYHISIDANDIPLDVTLGDSLPPPHRQLYEQFDADGVAHVQATVFTSGDANDVGPITYLADVSASAASLKLEKLPLTLSGVSAEASITPESLNLKRLAGFYGESPVALTGTVRFAEGDTRRQVHLKVSADGVPLAEELIGLLPESLEQHVVAFHPEGKVNLAIDFKETDSNEPADYTVAVECLGNKITYDRFAYPLQDVLGTMTMTRSGVTLKGIEARPVASASDLKSSVHVDGSLNLADGGLRTGSLTIAARDVPFSAELGDALPAAFAGVYRDLSPRGPFDLNLGTLDIAKVAKDETRVHFKGDVDSKMCSLNVSGAGTELCGVLNVEGIYNTKDGFSSGRMELDAERLTIKGKSITSLNADVLFDPNAGTWSAENFLGDCHGGRILGNLDVDRVGDGVLRYILEVAFHRVDLQQFVLAGKVGEAPSKNYSSGTMNASLSLGSRVGDGSSRLGICRVNVVDMQVGKVSPLAKLLSVLRLTELTDYTFEQMLIDSYLRRNTLLIQKFDMSGRNVAFAGSGTMDLPSGQIDLTLTARGKRVATAEPSVLQSLTEGLGGGVVRMEVTGKAEDPQVETKALPVIEESLKILGASR